MIDYRQILKISSQSLTAILFGGMLLGLLIVGGIHGSFTAEDAAVTENEVNHLHKTVGNDANIAVIGTYTYYRTVLYSQGKLRPTVIIDHTSGDNALYLTEAADIRIINSASTKNIRQNYVFIIQKCEDFTDREKSFIENMEIVYKNHRQSTGCDTRSVLLKNN